ncbi:NAD-P-binding protein [Mycena vulgaris]|nr:NAD-P-binding protein [Mycena vulgaris]
MSPPQITLVTSGNTGIGYETFKQLLLKNTIEVYLAARSPEKPAAALKRLEQETKKSAVFIQLDLADLRKFGTNVLGHFFLTELLIPALIKSYEETQIPGRVINTSIGHQMAMEYASLKGGPARDAWLQAAGSEIVRREKLGNILVSNYLAKQYSDLLVSCALCPGGIATDLCRHMASWMQLSANIVAYLAPMAAYMQLWGATVATPAQITGQSLISWGQVGSADKRASSTKLEGELIAYLKEQIKGF